MNDEGTEVKEVEREKQEEAKREAGQFRMSHEHIHISLSEFQ